MRELNEALERTHREYKRKRDEEAGTVKWPHLREFEALRREWASRVTEPSAADKVGEVIAGLWRSNGGVERMTAYCREVWKDVEVTIEGPLVRAWQVSVNKEAGPCEVWEMHTGEPRGRHVGMRNWWGDAHTPEGRYVGQLEDAWAALVERRQIEWLTEFAGQSMVANGQRWLREVEEQVKLFRHAHDARWPAVFCGHREVKKITVKVGLRKVVEKEGTEPRASYPGTAGWLKEKPRGEMELYVKVYVA